MIGLRAERILMTLMLAALLLPVAWQPSAAQPQCTVNVQVVPLESVNIGDLIFAGEIRNTTVYATIFIGTSNPLRARIEGIIEVKLPSYSDFRTAGTFRTTLFDVSPPGRNVLNTDFPNVIDVETAEGNSDVIDDIREVGRPAGGFRFTVNVEDETGNLCGSGFNQQDILNPALITRTSPADGSEQQQENVLFSWTANPGFSGFNLGVNSRQPGQSPEDALGTNQPPIFSGAVGTSTSVNLRDLSLQRQVLPGMELVWQVTGIVSGIGEGSEVPTDIGAFSILDPNSALMTAALNRLILLLQQLGFSDLASQLQGGEMALTGEIQLRDGSRVSFEDLMGLLSYLEENRDNIVDVRVE